MDSRKNTAFLYCITPGIKPSNSLMLQQQSRPFKAHDKSQPSRLEKIKLKSHTLPGRAKTSYGQDKHCTVLSKKMLIYHKDHNLAFNPLSGLFTFWSYSILQCSLCKRCPKWVRSRYKMLLLKSKTNKI